MSLLNRLSDLIPREPHLLKRHSAMNAGQLLDFVEAVVVPEIDIGRFKQPDITLVTKSLYHDLA
jgi:hypothetical protein